MDVFCLKRIKEDDVTFFYQYIQSVLFCYVLSLEPYKNSSGNRSAVAFFICPFGDAGGPGSARSVALNAPRNSADPVGGAGQVAPPVSRQSRETAARSQRKHKRYSVRNTAV